jgi:hypothetical protein
MARQYQWTRSETLQAATLLLLALLLAPKGARFRRQWEYSRAVNAIITLMAFLAAVGSVILSRRPS